MTGEDLIARALKAHEVLGRESDLSPCNATITAALSALVQGIMEGCPPSEVSHVLSDPGIRGIRSALVERLSLAESAMERHWAAALCRRATLAAGDLRAFTYWDCYRHLVRDELRSLVPRLRLREGESLAFVGAGPLPLSAIIVHMSTGLKVTCIDIDAGACGLGSELCRKAGCAGIEVRCAAGAHHDYACNPVVVIASLVPEKARVMQRIRATRPQALVGLRSVEGLCTLLYDPVDETELAALGCRYIGRTRHNPHAINTTLLYEAAPARRAAFVRGGGRGAGPGLPLLRVGRRTARPRAGCVSTRPAAHQASV
jgi:hypothetical protein